MYHYETSVKVKGPYSFDYVLNHYNIYPWFKEEKKLCRILRLKDDSIIKVEITSEGSIFDTTLFFSIITLRVLSKNSIQEIIEKLSWCLLLNEEYEEYYKMCKDDPVLMAAEREKRYGRGKLYPDIFEGIIGVILSQNVSFKRIYQMMKNLCLLFGNYILIGNNKYYAFPKPENLANKSIEDIKKAKVGYRAKYIKQIAKKIVDDNIDLESFRLLNNEELRKKLMEFPGIGIYSANLIMRVAFNRNVYHIDSYVKKIIESAYFNGRKLSVSEVEQFIQNKWGELAHYAIDALTTNTEVWSRKIGLEINVKSGAKGWEK
jgi:3-methyladenine DNA glycosylase/8-oxoguanine DNA glycosylase